MHSALHFSPSLQACKERVLQSAMSSIVKACKEGSEVQSAMSSIVKAFKEGLKCIALCTSLSPCRPLRKD